tara:strand:- start:34 stop:897 length:864 start_codon:yes stop_codon:yes gene_type:complete
MTAKNLKITNSETQYGRPVYLNTTTGERHSELSTTFFYEGKWINIPTIHFGEFYNDDELKRMIKNSSSKLELDGNQEKLYTSEHDSEAEAIKAAKFRSSNIKETSAKNVMQTFGNFDILNEKNFMLVMDDIKRGKKEKKMKAAMSSYKPRSTPEMDTGTRFKSELSDIRSTGPNRRQSNKPKNKFEYKPHMNPEEKMNDARSLKGLTPNYGEMPGFKQPLDAKGNKQGYWDADENSDFWKTDAGYDKAIQTWGREGGTLPQFVTKPTKKEIDIKGIKKFFNTGNNGY